MAPKRITEVCVKVNILCLYKLLDALIYRTCVFVLVFYQLHICVAFQNTMLIEDADVIMIFVFPLSFILQNLNRPSTIEIAETVSFLSDETRPTFHNKTAEVVNFFFYLKSLHLQYCLNMCSLSVQNIIKNATFLSL